jgi:hypothetical protein
MKRTQRATRDHQEEGNLAARHGAGSAGGEPWRRLVSGDLSPVTAQCDTAWSNQTLNNENRLQCKWITG